MIDENIKNHLLAKLQKVLEKWTKVRSFYKPRPRWFKIGSGELDGVHAILGIWVGKDEEETKQILEDLIELEKKYIADEKEVSIAEDYLKEKF